MLSTKQVDLEDELCNAKKDCLSCGLSLTLSDFVSSLEKK